MAYIPPGGAFDVTVTIVHVTLTLVLFSTITSTVTSSAF